MLVVIGVTVCLIVGCFVVSLVVFSAIVEQWTFGEKYLFVAVSLAMC